MKPIKLRKPEVAVNAALAIFMNTLKRYGALSCDLVANFSEDFFKFRIVIDNGKSKSTISTSTTQETS